MKNKKYILFLIFFLILILFGANLFIGSVNIPFSQVLNILSRQEADKLAWTNIILQYRLPQAVTALFAGAALAVCGLMLQTLFQNPLAGPSILGISNGADFGVALVMLYFGGRASQDINWSVLNHLSVIGGAFIGSLVILGIIIYFSTKIKNNILILIIGMMISYLVSSGISILNSFAASENVHAYVMWGMGTFSNVPSNQIIFFCITISLGLILSILLIKPLNILLLGERYASNLGIHIQRTRILILLCTGLLTAMVTAFCGPISFIGLAVPHIARLLLNTSNQKILLPATLLFGSVVALLCNLLTVLPVFGVQSLPLNAVTPIFGAPIIIYVILNKRNAAYFR